MKFRFGLENGKRRPLANALGEAMNAEVRYLGAPTFCFEVGRCLLDRDGLVDIPVEAKPIEVLSKLAAAGFHAEGIGPGPKAPARGKPMHEKTEQAEPAGEGFIISIPAQDFSPRVRDNLDKLLAAKGGLVMAALGVGRLQYSEDHGYLAFDLYDSQPEQKELDACTDLLNALYTTAREQVRVTAKAQADIDNPKYAMRCFLLKLGFIGPEYKETRSLLLSRLPGNGSFKSKK